MSAYKSGLSSNNSLSYSKHNLREQNRARDPKIEEVSARVHKIKKTYHALMRYIGREQESSEESRSLSPYEMAQMIFENDERWAKFQASLRDRDDSGVMCFTMASLKLRLFV